MGTRYLAIKSERYLSRHHPIRQEVADGCLARTAGFEVFTVCLSIGVSVMRCSSRSSRKFVAEPVKTVRNVS